MNTIKKTSLIIALGLLAGLSSPVSAQSNQKSLDVRMGVDLQCSVRSVTDVNFANYTGAASALPAQVLWQCTKTGQTQTVTVKIDCGLNGAVSGTSCANKMKNQDPGFPSSYLNYRLCIDTNCATPYPAAGRIVNYNSTGNAVSANFFVQVLANQYGATYGDYSDTITTSVIF